ncbi:hypothetical protein ACHAXN_001461 [Cyclotella atomus]
MTSCRAVISSSNLWPHCPVYHEPHKSVLMMDVIPSLLRQHRTSSSRSAANQRVRLFQLTSIRASSNSSFHHAQDRSAPIIHVWEQTVSESIARSNNQDKQKTPGRGTVCYRPSASGWKIITSDLSNNPSSFLSSLLSKLSLYKKKDMNNLQNIPFIHHFLPANYPHSVCPSYTTYASYCFAGSIAGSAAMVLSTQALLLAVGVGQQSAAPMAAAMNWVMKDGVGQLGGVIFASQLGKGGIDVGYWKSQVAKVTGGSKHSNGNFQTGTADSNPKRWRMVAAIALDASTLLEICTPLMGPQWFLPCASIANVGKNIGFLAASASRAAIHQSLCMGGSVSQSSESNNETLESKAMSNSEKGKSTTALSFNNNLGDVTAKSGSQAIVASLLGTALGILLSQTFCADHGTTGILAGFIVLSAAHQVCTYKALRAVPLKSLDRHRLHICLSDYIEKNNDSLLSEQPHMEKTSHRTLSPIDVSDRDFFIPLMPPDESVNWLTIGAPLLEICPGGSDDLGSLLIPKKLESNPENGNYEQYIIKVGPNNKNIMLTFLDGAAEYDVLKGMFNAYIAREIADSSTFSYEITQNSYNITNHHIASFTSHLQKSGWEVGQGYVSVECGSSHRLRIQVAQ